MRHGFALRPEIHRLVAARLQFTHQVVDRLDIGFELCRAQAYQADQMTIGTAGRRETILRNQLSAALVLAPARSAVERLDCDHVLQRPLALIMLVETDIRPPRMTRHDDSAHPRDFIYHS